MGSIQPLKRMGYRPRIASYISDLAFRVIDRARYRRVVPRQQCCAATFYYTLLLPVVLATRLLHQPNFLKNSPLSVILTKPSKLRCDLFFLLHSPLCHPSRLTTVTLTIPSHIVTQFSPSCSISTAGPYYWYANTFLSRT